MHNHSKSTMPFETWRSKFLKKKKKKAESESESEESERFHSFDSAYDSLAYVPAYDLAI